MSKSKISLIVPVFNERAALPLFMRAMLPYLSSCNEIIFVNDGSSDKTLEFLTGIQKKYPIIKIISLKSNSGQIQAILAGIKAASSEAVIVIDADLQDPPSLIPRMIAKWQDGSRIILPRRVGRRDSWIKIWSAKLFYLILGLTGNKLDPSIGEFYLLDREVVNILIEKAEEGHLFLRGVIQKINIPKIYISYDRSDRVQGKSGYTLAKMLRLSKSAIFKTRWERPEIERLVGFEVRPKVAIIGGGISGLACAYHLSNLFSVVIFEKDRETGGLLATTNISSRPIERFYHHFFLDDRALIDLLDDLKLTKKILWQKSSSSFLEKNFFYDFNSPRDIFNLRFLGYWAKIRFVLGSLLLLFWPEKWLVKITAIRIVGICYGKEVKEKIWQPMLRSKFGQYSDRVSALWLVRRLKTRLKTRKKGREILGYLDGSMSVLTESLRDKVERNGGQIAQGKVKKIRKTGDKFIVNGKVFDFVINTTSDSFFKEKKPKHLGVINAIFELKSSFSPYYWTNVLDNLPLTVIVEQTNLVGTKKYSGRSAIYVGRYLEGNSSLFCSSETEIKHIFIKALEKIKPGFRDNLVSSQIWRSTIAQPVIDVKFQIPKSPAKNYYLANMAQIFPDDRGVNNALLRAKEVATKLIQDWNQQ